MEELKILGIAVGAAGSLLTVVWQLVQRDINKQAEAIEQRATVAALNSAEARHREALAAAEERHREEMKDVRSQLAEVNRRQEREVDMINTSITRVDLGVTELRKEMVAANARISQSLQDIQSTINRGRRNE